MKICHWITMYYQATNVYFLVVFTSGCPRILFLLLNSLDLFILKCEYLSFKISFMMSVALKWELIHRRKLSNAKDRKYKSSNFKIQKIWYNTYTIGVSCKRSDPNPKNLVNRKTSQQRHKKRDFIWMNFLSRSKKCCSLLK